MRYYSIKEEIFSISFLIFYGGNSYERDKRQETQIAGIDIGICGCIYNDSAFWPYGKSGR